MTYGWAILVVLIVISALAYMYISKPEKVLGNRCVFTAGFNCLGARVTPKNATIVLENKLGLSLYNLRANATDNSYLCAAAPSPCADGCRINVTCNVTTFTSGTFATMKIMLIYRKSQNGYDQTSFGDVYENVN